MLTRGAQDAGYVEWVLGALQVGLLEPQPVSCTGRTALCLILVPGLYEVIQYTLSLV